MEAASLAQKMGIHNTAAVSKARELERLLGVRAATGLGAGEGCRGAVCLALACRAANTPFDREKACTLCCATPAQFSVALTAAQRLLGNAIAATATAGAASGSVTVNEACRRVGRLTLISETTATLEGFKQRFLARLPPCQRPHANFDSVAFVGAALYIVAMRRKAKLTRAQVAAALDITTAELSRSVLIMNEQLGTTAASPSKDSEAKKRPRESEDAEEVVVESEERRQDDDAFAAVRKQLSEELIAEAPKRRKQG